MIKHSRSEGLLSLSYKDSDGREKMGTVCGDFNFNMSDEFCKKFGYQYGDWGESKYRKKYATQQ